MFGFDEILCLEQGNPSVRFLWNTHQERSLFEPLFETLMFMN